MSTSPEPNAPEAGAAQPVPPIEALQVAPRVRPSNYPPEFAARMAGRTKRPLGDRFGLGNFGVNLTTLAAGAVSSLHHAHSRQDEFIYVLEGHPTLYLGDARFALAPGMAAGFPADAAAHHLANHTDSDVVFLEVGDRSADDRVSYPADDLEAALVDGRWVFRRKDGTPF